eukprot:120861-Chlamydomonas_euryale.AAC.2
MQRPRRVSHPVRGFGGFGGGAARARARGRGLGDEGDGRERRGWEGRAADVPRWRCACSVACPPRSLWGPSATRLGPAFAVRSSGAVLRWRARHRRCRRCRAVRLRAAPPTAAEIVAALVHEYAMQWAAPQRAQACCTAAAAWGCEVGVRVAGGGSGCGVEGPCGRASSATVGGGGRGQGGRARKPCERAHGPGLAGDAPIAAPTAATQTVTHRPQPKLPRAQHISKLAPASVCCTAGAPLLASPPHAASVHVATLHAVQHIAPSLQIIPAMYSRPERCWPYALGAQPVAFWVLHDLLT